MEKRPIAKITNFIQQAKFFVTEAWRRLNNFEQTCLEVGVRQFREGSFFDASVRFRIAAHLNKTNPIAHYMLGKSLVYLGKQKQAIAPLKTSLALNPDLEEAEFLLASCGERVNLRRVPPSLVHEQHEALADVYDQLVQSTYHKVNEVLRAELEKYYGTKQGLNVLILSCRGGDMAEIIRDKANKITGVEMSLKMTALSRQRRIDEQLVFNEVLNKYPLDYLKDSTAQFDLAIATFFIPLFGDLTELLKLTAARLNEGGVFAFNVELFAGTAIGLNKKTLSFMHSAEYLNEVCTEAGFRIISNHQVSYSNGNSTNVLIAEKI